MSQTSVAPGFEAPDPTQLAPLFPGYDLECLIATGGMGAVYRAVQRSLDRTVALKILPREFSADAAFCAGFEAEAKAMARLNHPNLIGVYDFGEIEGMLFIIMEFVPGQSLFHSANGLAIDPGEVVRLVTGICSGLAHAHKHGILHRDIKPANILLDLQAEPKIGDFGLARPVDRKIEDGEEIFGTPHYTAPEVVAAPHSVDHRADVFSVGVVLHELLTGKLPADDPRPASAIAGCDPRFDAVIRCATHPAVGSRYASASDLAQDLNKIATTRGPRVLQTAATPAAVPVSRALPGSRALAGSRALPGSPALSLRPGRQVSVKQPSNAPAIITVVVLLILAAIIFAVASRRPPPTVEAPAPLPEWERALQEKTAIAPPGSPGGSPDRPAVPRSESAPDASGPP